VTFPPAHVPPQMVHRPHVPAVVKGERAQVEGSDAAKREDPRSLPEAVLICRVPLFGLVAESGPLAFDSALSVYLPYPLYVTWLGCTSFILFRRAWPVAGV